MVDRPPSSGSDATWDSPQPIDSAEALFESESDWPVLDLASEPLGPASPAAKGPGERDAGREVPRPTAAVPNDDLILIIGRPGAGKTVFLARLFDELHAHSLEADSWRRHAMSIVATDEEGRNLIRAHRTELASGSWPMPTAQWNQIDCEVQHPRGSTRIRYVDYPGEVFSNAFSAGIKDERTRPLLDAIGTARHVMLLVDLPTLLERRDRRRNLHDERARTDNTDGMFGLVQALRDRGGVPISIILTKGDLIETMLAAAGFQAEVSRSLIRYKSKRDVLIEYLLPAVLREAKPQVEVDVVTAVRTGAHPDGAADATPDLSLPPKDLVEAFKRVIHRTLLRRIQKVGIRPPHPDIAELRKLLKDAEACKLDPGSFPEVRIARNRLRRHDSGPWLRGARIRRLLDEIKSLEPGFPADLWEAVRREHSRAIADGRRARP